MQKKRAKNERLTKTLFEEPRSGSLALLDWAIFKIFD
jgi:hypothetical protein